MGCVTDSFAGVVARQSVVGEEQRAGHEGRFEGSPTLAVDVRKQGLDPRAHSALFRPRRGLPSFDVYDV